MLNRQFGELPTVFGKERTGRDEEYLRAALRNRARFRA
jgi:hypothetical protein